MSVVVRSRYPNDISDEEWTFVAAYLALCREDAAQQEYSLREVFNALRYIVKTANKWWMMPHDLPSGMLPMSRYAAGVDVRCFEAMVEDLRVLLREYAGLKSQPTAMILDSRTLQSTPKSDTRGGYDRAKRRKGAKIHAAADALGHLLTLHVTSADELDRAQVEYLADVVQQFTGYNVELAYVNQSHTDTNVE